MEELSTEGRQGSSAPRHHLPAGSCTQRFPGANPTEHSGARGPRWGWSLHPHRHAGVATPAYPALLSQSPIKTRVHSQGVSSKPNDNPLQAMLRSIVSFCLSGVG